MLQQLQDNSQASNSGSQSITNVVRRKRKLAKPRKVRKKQDGNDVPDTSGMVSQHFLGFFVHILESIAF